MRRMAMTILMAGLAVAVGVAQTPAPTPGGLRADLERDWMAQKKRMVDMAEAMPAEKYEFKATPAQRSYGEQLHHLAEAHVNMLKRLDPGAVVPVPAISKTHTRDAVVKALNDAYDYGAALLKSNAVADWSKGAKEGDPAPARTVWAAMNNASNHYGQCVVYLRLNEIVPPASRR